MTPILTPKLNSGQPSSGESHSLKSLRVTKLTNSATVVEGTCSVTLSLTNAPNVPTKPRQVTEVCHTAAILSSLLSTEVVKTDATSSSLCDGVDDLMQESSFVL